MPDTIPDLLAAVTNLANREGRVSRYRAMLEEAVRELGKLGQVSTNLVCEHCNTRGQAEECPGCHGLRVPQIVIENRLLEEKILHLEEVIRGFMGTDGL